MSTGNDDVKPKDNMEALKQQAEACGAGCSCHGGAGGGGNRWVFGVLVLVIAGVLVARAMLKTDDTAPEKVTTGFVPVQATAPVPEPAQSATPTPTLVATVSDAAAWKEIAAFSELNAVARDTDAVFVVVPGKGDATAQVPRIPVESAVKTIGAKGQKIAVFTLKPDSKDYGQIAAQMTVPGVLAIVKGGGMSATAGDVTEATLIQTFVAASSSGGCGPASGGCGPRGCN